MQEEWKRMIYHDKDLGDFYLVSNLGQIKGVKSGKVRSRNINHEGYYFVGISLGNRQTKSCIKVHRAVAETFIANPNNYPVINHIDGNKLNNCVDNLEWCTQADNTRHAWDNGLITPKRGVDNHWSKLTSEDVKYIREHYILGDNMYGTRGLARKFGVTHEVIRKVIHNQSYIDV